MEWGRSREQTFLLKGRIGLGYGVDKIDPKFVKTVVDIGANVGLFSIWARLFFPNSKIIAIEPVKSTYKKMRRNMRGWGVDAVRLAIGKNGITNVITDSLRHRTFCARTGICLGASEIKSVSLSKFFSTYIIDPSTTFLKIDCEGCECEMQNIDDEAVLSNSAAVGFEWHSFSKRCYKNSELLNIKKWTEKLFPPEKYIGKWYTGRRAISGYAIRTEFLFKNGVV